MGDVSYFHDYVVKKDKAILRDLACMEQLLTDVKNYFRNTQQRTIVKEVEPDGVVGVLLGNGIHCYYRTFGERGVVQASVSGLQCWHEQHQFVEDIKIPYNFSGTCSSDISTDPRNIVEGSAVKQHIIFQTGRYCVAEMEKIFAAVQRVLEGSASGDLLKIILSEADPDRSYDFFQLLDEHGYIVAHAAQWHVDVEICSYKEFDLPKILFHFGKIAKLRYVHHLV